MDVTSLSSSLALRILLAAVLCIHGVIGEECVSGRSDSPSFTPETADSLPYNSAGGYQVILPGLKFHCHGKILEWSALTVYRNNSGSTANYLAYFQVWRPNGTGRYVRVGYDEISVTHTELQPITSANPRDDGLLYFNLSGLVEDRTEDGMNNMDSEENNPLYFQPGDVVGFNIQRRGVKRSLYVTHHSPTDEDSEQLAMDLFYTTTTGFNQQCQMSECSENVTKLSSVVPHIHFTYEEVSPDDEAFQQQLLSTEDCETPIMELAECPTASPEPSSSSLTPSPTVPATEDQPATEVPLLYIVIAGGVLVILVAGGVFVMVTILVCRKRNRTSDNKPSSHREATNSLYSEMNGVEEPYASTYQTKNGTRHTYLELELSMPQHFALRTDHGSAMSVSSNQARPPLPPPPPHFVSSSVRAGPASMQRLPGQAGVPAVQNGGMHSGSLRQAPSSNTRPSIPTVMTSSPRSEGARRGSLPVKTRRESQQHLPRHPPNFHEPTGKSMPALMYSSVSPPPLPCPPTPEVSDLPVAYLTPEKPWYKSDYESTDIAMRPVPEEEGLYVPTMEERQCLEQNYSELRRPDSERCSGEVLFFEETATYEEPASSTVEIYQQLSNRKSREIIREYITVQDHLGSGHFARVHRGTWRTPQGEQDVAVKELKGGASEEDKVRFLQEAVIMGQFSHTNVVRLHGVVTIGEPLMIVMDLLPSGDLKNYLNRFTKRSSRRFSSSHSPPPSPNSHLPIPPSLPAQLLLFCRQVADGMSYLASKNFVHRDLAARNIFLTENFTCKIGDFGLARDLGGDDIYQSRGGQIPVKWTAPEALQYRQYTSASDVWSYGMLLFEIWSLGHRPFDACSADKDVVELIGSGMCQPPPPGCPRELYQLMVHCWNRNPAQRPPFSSICKYLNQSGKDMLELPSDLGPSISPQATQLGAPLAEAKGLYLDLQYCYDESVV